MGEANKRGTYEERKTKAIKEGSNHPKKKHITQRMITNIGVDAALAAMFKMATIPRRGRR